MSTTKEADLAIKISEAFIGACNDAVARGVDPKLVTEALVTAAVGALVGTYGEAQAAARLADVAAAIRSDMQAGGRAH